MHLSASLWGNKRANKSAASGAPPSLCGVYSPRPLQVSTGISKKIELFLSFLSSAVMPHKKPLILAVFGNRIAYSTSKDIADIIITRPSIPLLPQKLSTANAQIVPSGRFLTLAPAAVFPKWPYFLVNPRSRVISTEAPVLFGGYLH